MIDVLQFHIEAAPQGGSDWMHVFTSEMAGVASDMKTELELLGLAKPKKGAQSLDELPDDASAASALSRAELASVIKVSVMSAAFLDKVNWEKTAPRTGFVDAQDFERMGRGERVVALAKTVQINDALDNEEMAKRIGAGTIGWHHRTKVKYEAPLKHRVSSLFDVYTEHVRGQGDRRLIAVLGTK